MNTDCSISCFDTTTVKNCSNDSNSSNMKPYKSTSDLLLLNIEKTSLIDSIGHNTPTYLRYHDNSDIPRNKSITKSQEDLTLKLCDDIVYSDANDSETDCTKIYDMQDNSSTNSIFSHKSYDFSLRSRYKNGEHPFARINETKPSSYYDIDNEYIKWTTELPYKILEKVGQGKYSEVFIAINTNRNNEICILKCLKPISEFKIKREISLLKRLFGGPNIVKLLDTAFCNDTDTVILVFEYVESISHRDLFPTLTSLDIQFYMYQLLKALYFSHSRGIFHRDVKPQNILIDHSSRLIRLTDWGLAEYYHYNKDYNTRVASRHYKGPELLLKYRYYDYSLDIWSLGCVFASLIFRKDVFFCGKDDEDQLLVITKILGSEALFLYAESIGATLTSYQKRILGGYHKQDWNTFQPKSILSLLPLHISDTQDNRATDVAISLLNMMLVIDHRDRILPQHALLHPYFDRIRHLENL